MVPFNHSDRSISFGHKLEAYLDLYDSTVKDDKPEAVLFRNVHKNGTLTKQNMGCHHTANVGKEIANLMHLDNAESFTGHCFRRSAASQAAKAGATTPALKTHFG